MKSVFEYSDYREFLKDFYETKKAESSHFSYRYIAGKVGFKSPGHFTQILKGSANISIHLIERFAGFLKLNKKETEYFQYLVLFNQARNHQDKKRYYERLMSFRESTLKLLNADQYEFYTEWYNSAIREILNFYPFDGDYAKLAKMVDPPISSDDAKRAVGLLERLGMIEKKLSGGYRLTDAVMTTGYQARSVAINNHVLNSLKLAESALDHFPKEERNLSTVCMSVGPKGFATIVEELRAFRRKILEIARNDQDVDRAYQFNFQFFPLSRFLDEGGKK